MGENPSFITYQYDGQKLFFDFCRFLFISIQYFTILLRHTFIWVQSKQHSCEVVFCFLFFLFFNDWLLSRTIIGTLMSKAVG